MIIDLRSVLALEIVEKAQREKDSNDNWVPKKDGSLVHSLVFYQFGGDAKARQAELQAPQVDSIKKLCGKNVNISVDQRIYDNGNQKMSLVGISAAA